MGRIANKKIAKKTFRWILFLVIGGIAVWYYLNAGNVSTDESKEPTSEIINVNVRPGQGYEDVNH